MMMVPSEEEASKLLNLTDQLLTSYSLQSRIFFIAKIARERKSEKRMRMKNAIRTAFFLVPVVCATLLVLLCAFLIPCQKGGLGNRPQWERELGDAGGKQINNKVCDTSL